MLEPVVGLYVACILAAEVLGVWLAAGLVAMLLAHDLGYTDQGHCSFPEHCPQCQGRALAPYSRVDHTIIIVLGFMILPWIWIGASLLLPRQPSSSQSRTA